MFGFDPYSTAAFAEANTPEYLTATLFVNVNTFYTATLSATNSLTQTARFDSSNTFYAATVSSVAALQPARLNNTNTFYAATVSAGPVSLFPALYTNANTVYTPSVLATYALAPGLYTNGNAFYAAVLTPGTAPLIETARLDNVNEFYAAAIVPGPVGLLASLVTNVNVVYSPSAYVYTILSPPLVVDPDTFFDALLTGGSPVPVPYHPFCGRGSLTVSEAPRGNMVVTTLPRKSLTPSC